MCDRLAHGGPDDDGIFLDKSGKICLGHRRLSILDLTDAGHQPMEHNDIWISYNGEVYNYKELREELQEAGYTFQTGTDTEVILKAYQCWGVDSFQRLEGMFVFAIADLQLNKTFLVRGPEGIKPLYYTANEDRLIFASEVKAFGASGYDFAEDPNWKILFLAFGHMPEPYTTLEGVRMLPKGHYLEWNNETAEYFIKKFFSYKYSKAIKDPEEALEAVKTAVTAAVRRHMISDAPIGIFLSGGIDSSILTLLANQLEASTLKTLSINFQEAEFNERKYQQLVVNQIASDHTDYLITKEELERNFERILEAMDQPSADGINSWFISKYAKEAKVKAVLSGLGADELFGGYPSFDRVKTIAWLKMIPSSFLRLARKHQDLKIKRISYLALKNPIGEYLFLRGFYTPDIIAKILGINVKEVLEVLESCPIDPELNQLHQKNRISWLETNCYMQNQLLKDSDYMSMSHGIEIRVPFLDHQLVKTVLSIDPKIKFSKSQKKKILIDAFAELLPVEIWDRKKMGFTFPFQKWLRSFDKLANEDHYSDTKSKQLIASFKKGKLHWSAAFALYLIQNSKTPATEKSATIMTVEPLRLKNILAGMKRVKNQASLHYSLN